MSVKLGLPVSLDEKDKELERTANLPNPRGIALMIRGKADDDHAVDIINRKSRIGFTFYLNNSSMHRFSKKQNVLESSSFISEFESAKQSCE